jgi:hypothetical protein
MAESNERDVIGIAERNEEDLVLSDVHLGKIVQNPKERSKKVEFCHLALQTAYTV